MHYSTTTLPDFQVVGISVRTSNQHGQAQQDIGALWQRFFSENIAAQIPDKATDDIYCIYTDYETDASGPYTTFLGCRVSSSDNIPEGLETKTIPAARYQKYNVKGPIPQCVLQTWQHIWQSPINRKYTADFDVYGSKAQDPENAEVETYLSIS